MNANEILFNIFHPFLDKVVRPPLHRLGFELVIKEWNGESKNPYEALEPYLHFIKSYKPDSTHKHSEKIIWQFWWQGADNAPEIVKRCMQSVRHHAGEYQIVVLDKDNIGEYVNLPDCIREKHDKGIITHTHLSDYIRVCLLEKYGGVWIDATVLLTGPIPQDILSSKFFFYRATGWARKQNIPDEALFPTTRRIFQILGGGNTVASTWFMVGTSNSSFPSLLRHLFELYWQGHKTLTDYFLLHQFMTLCIVFNPFCRSEFLSECPNYDNIQPHLLQFALSETFSSSLSDEIKRRSTIHKLTYKFQNDGFGDLSFYANVISGRFN